MSGDPGITTFLVPHSPKETARHIRRALLARGLTIAGEIDLAARLGAGLRVGFPACEVMCVDCPAALLEALAFERSAAVLVPIHLVVTEHDGGTAVHMLNPSAALYDALPVTARPAVSRLIGAVTRTLEAISARHHAVEAYL
jgi:uncharacterized protein (DUF302 family)